jgi:hypothetical protein
MTSSHADDAAAEACALLAHGRASAEQGAAALAVARDLTAWHSEAADAFHVATDDCRARADGVIHACEAAVHALRSQLLLPVGGAGEVP